MSRPATDPQRAGRQIHRYRGRIAELVRERNELVKALQFFVSYEEDAFAGTPQGEPRWLKKYRRLLAKHTEKVPA